MKRILISKNLFILLFADVILLAGSYYCSFLVRFEAHIPAREWLTLKNTILPIIACKMMIFYFFNLYRGMWRYTSIVDMLNVIKATMVSSGIIVAVILFLHRFQGFSRGVFVIDAVFTLILIGGVRLVIRLYFTTTTNTFFPLFKNESIERIRLLIVGAGDAGEKALRELRDNPRLRYEVVAFIDDDPYKIGRSIHNVPVVDNLTGLNKAVETLNVDEVLIAIPSATGPQMRRIVEVCKGCGAPFKTLPGLGELIEGKVSIKALRDVDYQDLLGRPPVKLDAQDIRGYLEKKRVLVTGAGGSIGSELCRQMVRFNPESLILLDASEANLFSIQMELKHNVGYQRYATILGSVQNGQILDRTLARYQPQIIFHAAAYKHVSMVELNPWQAVHNNIHGSQMIMEKAINHGVDHFVLVSTDKAVRPTNVMGASKRVAEMLLQSYVGNHTRMMAVRFGNVVGSSGSVIPLFREQIARGGPVTVTHPDVTRYFMTIPEACQLILQAGALGADGEIFILEMGTPVRIVDMARDLIRLSGKEPDRDIEIEFKGLEPGEKLYEELITEGEGIVPTEHDKIMVLKPDGKWNYPQISQIAQKKGNQEGFRRWVMCG